MSLIWREENFADDVLVWVFSVSSPVFFLVNGRLVVVVVGLRLVDKRQVFVCCSRLNLAEACVWDGEGR